MSENSLVKRRNQIRNYLAQGRSVSFNPIGPTDYKISKIPINNEELDSVIVSFLKDSNNKVKLSTLVLVRQIGEKLNPSRILEWVPNFVDLYIEGDSINEVNEEIKYLIIHFTDVIFKEFIRLFSSSDTDDFKCKIIYLIGELTHHSIPLVHFLIERLDENENIRKSSVLSLGKIGAIEAADYIEKLLLNDKSFEVKEYCAESLGRISSKDSLPVLVKALQMDKPKLKIKIVEAIGQIGERSEDITDKLLTILRNDNSNINLRIEAVKTLRKLGECKAITIFEKILLSNKETALVVEIINAINKMHENCTDAERVLADLYKLQISSASYEIKKAAKIALREMSERMGLSVDDIQDLIFSRYKLGDFKLPIQMFEEHKPILRDIINKGETNTVEFKSSLRWDIEKQCVNKQLEFIIAKVISSFLNSDGGTLFIGIDPNGKSLGIEADIKTLKSKDRDTFLLRISDLIKTHIGLQYNSLIGVYIEEIDEVPICIVEVVSSPNPIVTRKKNKLSFYIRALSSTRKLDLDEAIMYSLYRWR